MNKRIVFKLVLLGGLSVLLLIALASINGITNERRWRLEEVQSEIASSYAGPQKIIGPFLILHVQEKWNERQYNREKNLWYEEGKSAERSIIIYPDELEYVGDLTVEERYRGIFKANVFQSSGTISGMITVPKLELLCSDSGRELELLDSMICMVISDPRGIAAVSKFMWDETELAVVPGSSFARSEKGVHAEISDAKELLGKTVKFSLEVNLYGTGSFEFVPLGSRNTVRMESSWPHPCFVGDFLAVERTVSSDGFKAVWNVNSLASSAQQQMDTEKISDVQSFGVKLIDPVNPYPLTDRALKYGFLFIFITFAAFFLFELIRQLKIHPIQYGFVGLAQALFFLLLLSLSEHIGFGAAYLLASVATIGVITFYLCAILKGVARGLIFGGLLSFLYAVLFGLLQSEDHALVAGSVLIFGLLGMVMISTRKIDWYALTQSGGSK